jgi:hypothetical protein
MRLGCLKRGTLDVIEHQWFRNFPWDSIYRQEIRAPHLPAVRSQLLWALERSKKKEQPIIITNEDDYKTYFINF